MIWISMLVTMKKRSKISIRLDLESNLADMFLALKEKTGIKSNTELVRILISQEYRRLISGE